MLRGPLQLLVALALLLGGCCTSRGAAVPSSHAAPPGVAAGGDPATQVAKIRSPADRAVLVAAGIAPEQLACNDQVIWRPELSKLARRLAAELATHEGLNPSAEQARQRSRIALGYLVRMVFQYVGTQNIGVMALDKLSYRDARGKRQPLLVFRSAVTTDAQQAGSCLQTLLGVGRVKHVVNLYGGHFPFHDFIEAEKQVTQAHGAGHFDVTASGNRWRDLIKSPALYRKNKTQAMRQVAAIIRDALLLPGGKPPQGNLYLHCGGGMHRSGMVFGVLRRCINHDSMAVIASENQRHTAYRSSNETGGFEALNLRFIEEFDCSLIEPALARLRHP